MSSSDRVLSGHAPDATAVALLDAPQRHHDAATRAALEEARAAGFAEGLAQGTARGRSELATAAAELGGDVRDQVAALREDVAAQHSALAVALEQRVLAAVRAVLGREPDDEGRALLDALRRVVADVDAPRLEVRVAPDRLELVRTGLADVAGLDVVADDGLGAGDARVLAPTVDVDLRRERLLDELAALLCDGPPLGELVTEREPCDG